MKRTLMMAVAGVAVLSLSACNRPAEETTADDTAMEAEATTTTGDMSGSSAGASNTSGSAAAGSTAGSTSSTASSGSMSSGMASGASDTSGSVTTTGQVDSSIPADAPSRNTRETAAAPGAANQGQVVPYAYSPTNPAVDPKR